MAQTPNQLAIASACFQCMDERTLLLIQVYLLNQILAGGGTGTGTSGTFAGTGSPQGVQVGSPGNTYLDTSGNHFWAKATGTSTNTGWVLLIN